METNRRHEGNGIAFWCIDRISGPGTNPGATLLGSLFSLAAVICPPPPNVR